MEDQYRDLVTALLPEGILDYFDVTHVQKDNTGLYIHLEERNVLPQELQNQRGAVYQRFFSSNHRPGFSHPGKEGSAAGEAPPLGESNEW